MLNVSNLKGARGFDSNFSFDCIIILQNVLSNIVIIIDLLLVTFLQGIIYLGFLIASNDIWFAILQWVSISWKIKGNPELLSIL